MGRKLRSIVPAHPNLLPPKLPDAAYIRHKEVGLKAWATFNVDRKHRAKALPHLSMGHISDASS